MARSAAAVPASKAHIGTIYAVEYQGELTRFQVTKITTHRVANTGSPHDYESEITGKLIFDADDTGKETTELVTLHPSRLKGEFTEYKELVAKKANEEKAYNERREAERQRAIDLVALFYKLTGLPIPNDRYSYHSAFRSDSSNGVDMNKDGVAAVLAALKQLVKEKETVY